MDQSGRIIENVAMWAGSRDSSRRTPEMKAAGVGLAQIHRDLPEIIGASSEMLARVDIDVSVSRTTSRRLADAATREIIEAGGGNFEAHERTEIVRRALRHVLVQEAAGRELERRSGLDPLRAADRDPHGTHGDRASATLRRQGVDVDALMGGMTEHDLRKTSAGAYEQVSLLARPALVKAVDGIDKAVNATRSGIDRTTGPRSPERPVPAVRAMRHALAPATMRQASFGRRMVQTQMTGAGM